MTETPNLLDHARALVNHYGFSVIPIPRADGAHDGKTPVIKWAAYQQRHPKDAELRCWFNRGPMNIAIITGAVSGIVVIDADSPDAEDWLAAHVPPTPWRVRPSRSQHHYYRHPGGSVSNRLVTHGSIKLDVKADGGYVIAPPSVHRSGVEYQCAGDWTATEVPVFDEAWLRDLLPSNIAPASAPVVHHHTRSLVVINARLDRAARYVAPIPKPQIGDYSDKKVYTVACKLIREFGLTESEATEVLWSWAGHRDGWSVEWISTKVKSAARRR